MVALPRMVALALLLTALAGCSGGGGSGANETGDGDELPPGSTPSPPPMPPAPPPPMPPEAPPVARDPVTWDISIEGTQFVDGSITIQVGDTVRWTHDDGATPHNVRSSSGATESFYSGGAPYMTAAPTRNTFEHEFQSVGDNPYVCEIHAGMSETITVLEFHNETPT